jgi:hypothetical protein
MGKEMPVDERPDGDQGGPSSWWLQTADPTVLRLGHRSHTTAADTSGRPIWMITGSDHRPPAVNDAGEWLPVFRHSRRIPGSWLSSIVMKTGLRQRPRNQPTPHAMSCFADFANA